MGSWFTSNGGYELGGYELGGYELGGYELGGYAGPDYSTYLYRSLCIL